MNDIKDERWTGTKLIKYVYNLELVPDDLPQQRMRVEDIPTGIEIITPPPGGLELPIDLEQLIREELAMTDAELEQAQKELPSIERRAFNRLDPILCKVASSHQQGIVLL